jgi:tetratricopeptide (TPR) repeat protein
MGRSFTRATVASVSEGEYSHALSQRQYRVRRKNGEFFLERSAQFGVFEKKIVFVMGSGNHARTYLGQAPDGSLLELPLTWYAEPQGHWAMSPGYDRPDHSDFRRRISDGCMFCHNGYPSDANGGLASGIDCQRCHGPGEEHVNSRGRILNPARLSPARQVEICMQCHLESASRSIPESIRRFERSPFSYRPSEPLGDFVIHFDAARQVENAFTVNNSAYGLRASACFRRSGTMTCSTCHNPHRVLRGAEADAHYTAACRTCHSTSHALSANTCVRCHMPKRRTQDATHVVMTDHRIRRRHPADDPLAAIAETHGRYSGEVTPYYPAALRDTAEDRLYVSLAELSHAVRPELKLPALRQAFARARPDAWQPYFELAEACRKAGLAAEAASNYEEAARRKPDHAPVHAGLAQTLISMGQSGRALATLQSAIRRLPRDIDLLNSLAVLHAQGSRFHEARPLLERALKVDSESPTTWLNYGVCLEAQDDAIGARRAYREALRLQPDLERARYLLRRLGGGTPQ